jgi:hypothetical protein
MILIATGREIVNNQNGNSELFLTDRAKGKYIYRFTPDSGKPIEITTFAIEATRKYLQLSHKILTIVGDPLH